MTDDEDDLQELQDIRKLCDRQGLENLRKFRHQKRERLLGTVLPTWHIGPDEGRTADFSKIDPDGDLLYVGASEHLTHRLLNMAHVMRGALHALTDPSTVTNIAVAFWLRNDCWLYERYLQSRCAPLWSGNGFSDKRRIERNKRREHYEPGQRYVGRFVDPDRYTPGKFVCDSATALHAQVNDRGRIVHAYAYEHRRAVRELWSDAGLDAAGVYAWLSVPAFTPERARAVLIGAGGRRRKALKRRPMIRQADELGTVSDELLGTGEEERPAALQEPEVETEGKEDA